MQIDYSCVIAIWVERMLVMTLPLVARWDEMLALSCLSAL